MRMLTHEAIIAHHLTHHDPILLFHITLIVLLSWTSSGEGDMFTRTIGDDFLVDELRAIIRIQAQDGKGEEGASVLQRGKHRILAFLQERQALGPAGCDIGQR